LIAEEDEIGRAGSKLRHIADFDPPPRDRRRRSLLDSSLEPAIETRGRNALVPDFMDALSDPRAFLSAQEKRAQQMKAMGIEESDISTTNIKGNTTGGAAAKKSEGVRFQEEPKEDLKFEHLTADSLRTEKGYNKATKKQQKELEAMRKKHSKERQLIQKQQCVSIEKLVKGKH